MEITSVLLLFLSIFNIPFIIVQHQSFLNISFSITIHESLYYYYYVLYCFIPGSLHFLVDSQYLLPQTGMGQHYSQMELPKCSGFRQIKSLPCTAVEYAVDSFPPHKGQEPDPHRMPPRFNAIAASVPSISQSSTIPSGGFLVGMIFLACFLLIFSAVLTGLTLVCELHSLSGRFSSS